MNYTPTCASAIPYNSTVKPGLLVVGFVVSIAITLVSNSVQAATEASGNARYNRYATVDIEGHSANFHVKPVYPEPAIKQGVEGYVVIQFNILANGAVDRPVILEAFPPSIFEQSAMAAIKQFRFEPQILDGYGVTIEGVINKFVFRLSPETKSRVREMEPFDGPTDLALTTCGSIRG